jgi:hypothetical protein
MDGFDVKPGWGRRSIAAISAAFAIFKLIQGPLSARFFAAGLLMMAWDFAFTPSPPMNTPLREVYAMARKGWRLPWVSKFLMAGSWVCWITSVYLELQGR